VKSEHFEKEYYGDGCGTPQISQTLSAEYIKQNCATPFYLGIIIAEYIKGHQKPAIPLLPHNLIIVYTALGQTPKQ